MRGRSRAKSRPIAARLDVARGSCPGAGRGGGAGATITCICSPCLPLSSWTGARTATYIISDRTHRSRSEKGLIAGFSSQSALLPQGTQCQSSK